ncbi:hypothetical protein, partial [Glaciimonas soli]
GTEGTPFGKIRKNNYPCLYAVALILFGPWKVMQALPIVGLSKHATQLYGYIRRLAPLIEELLITPFISPQFLRYLQTPAVRLITKEAVIKSLPSWFEETFGHNSAEDQQKAAQIWQEEPALRQLIQRLDAYWPHRYKPTVCPMCNSTSIQKRYCVSSEQYYGCTACSSHFSATHSTPFHRLRSEHYRRLYATALVLWGTWKISRTTHVIGCSIEKQVHTYIARLQPLIDELDVRPLTSRPSFRFGITPAQQGIRCMRCDSDDLIFWRRNTPDNPTIKCNSCQHSFALHVERRQSLPIPDSICCPACTSKNLLQEKHPDGRYKYRCKDCRSAFMYPPKNPNQSKHASKIPLPPVPAGTSCPLCASGDVYVKGWSPDRRPVFKCRGCARQFISNPKRPASQTRPLIE